MAAYANLHPVLSVEQNSDPSFSAKQSDAENQFNIIMQSITHNWTEDSFLRSSVISRFSSWYDPRCWLGVKNHSVNYSITNWRKRNSFLIERRTRDRTTESSNPSRSGGGSEHCVLALIHFWFSFHPHVTAVAHKRPGHSAKIAGGRLHLNTHTPLT